jgi:hypothetical protein
MVVALLAVTIGSIAVISTRVAHREIRKIEVKVQGDVASRRSCIASSRRRNRSIAGFS